VSGTQQRVHTARRLLGIAQNAAEQAGELLLASRQRAAAEQKSSATDLVSDADRNAEALIRNILQRQRPADAIVGEELGIQPGSSGVSWSIDPLDGTTNYLRGYPGWAVSIAAADSDGTLAGVVFDPKVGAMYAAGADGATLNGRELRVSTTSDLAVSIVGIGVSYDADVRARQGVDLAINLPQIGDIRRGGSAALELCHVATGALDAFVEDDLEPWDWAAGAHIVQQAGGVVTPLARAETRGILVSTPGIAPQLRRSLQLT
jgi:myo-inositol-1(or 4)-monophosphatase